MMRPKLLLLWCMALAGCAHFTDAPPPSAGEIPARWSVTELHTPPADAPVNGQWWTAYNDPVLNALIEQAVARNTDLRLAAERVVQADALRRGAQAGLFPDSVAEISVSGASGGSDASGQETAFAGVGLAWQPDFSGGLSAALRAARAGLAASREDADTVRHMLIAVVAQTYIDYRLQRALLTLSEDTMRSQENSLKLIQERYKRGVSGNLDVQRARVLVNQTRASHAQALADAEAARFRLATLLAATPETLSEQLGTKEAPIPSADAPSLLAMPSELLAQRPDVRAARARYEAAAATRQVADAARWPSLSLAGLLGFEGGSLGDIISGRSSINTVSAGLLAPVFSFGRLSAHYDAADSQFRQAGLGYERAAQQAVEDTQTALVRYVQGEQRYAALREAAASAQHAADISTLQYEQGIISQFELLDSERTVIQAQREEAHAKAEVASRIAIVYWNMAIAPEASQDAATPEGEPHETPDR